MSTFKTEFGALAELKKGVGIIQPKLDNLFCVRFYSNGRKYENLSNQVIAVSRPSISGAHKVAKTPEGSIFELSFGKDEAELQFEFQEDILNNGIQDLYDLMDSTEFTMLVDHLDGNNTLLDRITYNDCNIVEVGATDLDYAGKQTKQATIRMPSYIVTDMSPEIEAFKNFLSGMTISMPADGPTGVQSRVVTVTFSKAEHIIYTPPTLN